jgi:hypothetical protein
VCNDIGPWGDLDCCAAAADLYTKAGSRCRHKVTTSMHTSAARRKVAAAAAAAARFCGAAVRRGCCSAAVRSALALLPQPLLLLQGGRVACSRSRLSRTGLGVQTRC